MTPDVVHDLVLMGAGFVGGFLAKCAIDQLAEVAHNIRTKNKPVDERITVPSYYGQPYDRQPTHIERVTTMLDRLEEK